MIDKLEQMGCYKAKEDNGSTWIWPGQLGEFATKWDDKFLAMKDNNGEWFVFVTQFGSFGQR
jgi:hypothetical protein